MALDIDLQDLMARYQHGDSEAAATLVHQLSPQLYRFFLVKVVSRRHAEDLLQETWMRIHQVRHTYRRGQPVSPWLYAIARNIRVDHYRKAYRTESREERLEPAHDVAETSPEGAAGLPDFEALLATLPESQREVIAMLKVSGMSLEEVARATACSVGSVKQKVHRAYDRLRKAIAETAVPNRRGRGVS